MNNTYIPRETGANIIGNFPLDTIDISRNNDLDLSGFKLLSSNKISILLDSGTASPDKVWAKLTSTDWVNTIKPVAALYLSNISVVSSTEAEINIVNNSFDLSPTTNDIIEGSTKSLTVGNLTFSTPDAYSGAEDSIHLTGQANGDAITLPPDSDIFDMRYTAAKKLTVFNFLPDICLLLNVTPVKYFYILIKNATASPGKWFISMDSTILIGI